MTPTPQAIDAAIAAARASITAYSAFDSSMVPDDALTKVVTDALNAAFAVQFPPTKGQ
jgi:hypothetical protein